MRRRIYGIICLAYLAVSLCSVSAAQAVATEQQGDRSIDSRSSASHPEAPLELSSKHRSHPDWSDFSSSSLYLKVQVARGTKVSKLKPGDVVVGTLQQDIYSGDHELFPAGSVVRLTVSNLERQPRKPSDYWPWVVKAFTPRHENRPVFESASVFLAEKQEVPLQVRMITFGNERQVRAKGKKNATANISAAPSESLMPPQPASPARQKVGPVLVLEGMTADPEQTATELTKSHSSEPEIIAAGTQAKIILLADVSASKSHAGDSVQARLIEPVRLGTTVVLPEGSLFRGQIVKSQPPRVLSRSGSVMLKFTSLTIPGGNVVPIAASIGGVDVDQRSHTVIDPEGMMRGDRPGKAWMLLNLGVTSGIAKEADDGTQLLIEALVSTATDASTAGMAKIASTCASGIFMLTRHGRDVVLPKYTEMQIVFDRPVELPGLIAAK